MPEPTQQQRDQSKGPTWEEFSKEATLVVRSAAPPPYEAFREQFRIGGVQVDEAKPLAFAHLKLVAANKELLAAEVLFSDFRSNRKLPSWDRDSGVANSIKAFEHMRTGTDFMAEAVERVPTLTEIAEAVTHCRALLKERDGWVELLGEDCSLPLDRNIDFAWRLLGHVLGRVVGATAQVERQIQQFAKADKSDG